MEEESIRESIPRKGNSSKLDRRALERNRRLHMKDLFSKLASLIIPTSRCKSKVCTTIATLTIMACPSHVLVSEVITHVKQLQERVETLKQRKQILEATEETAGSSGSSSPVITVKDLGFILEACVICGLKKKLMLHQVINVLVEEAAEVIAVSHSTVGGRIFYTIYFQAVSSRIGIEISRVHQRLKGLIL
ncbi:transcription factor bHLH168-like [Vitis vinifera]|uniref:transcription factor bHLH168-like n=1 Tax=Vitis vinifera TaxID=29760 RepID=UPI002882EFCF|nr:transcription factor bHLH168-like [Vitis vinifera]